MCDSLWMWVIFLGIVVTLLALDLGIFHKKQHAISIKASLWMTCAYSVVALLFGLFIAHQRGLNAFSEYLTGFLVEKSLSLDNIFVTSLIFSQLAIPSEYQHRVLFFGIIGVIISRALMIGLGAQLIEFEWVLYLFSLFLIVTGIKMFFTVGKTRDVNNNKLLQWIRKQLRITNELSKQRFFVNQIDPITKRKRLFITPLFLCLVLIEAADIIFAVDSIPAIFTITKDPYIIYTSNIFAILGLRALYFALAAILHRFHYLKFALALVLIFIGAKLFIADLLGLEKIPDTLSLGVTIGLLAVGCFYSVYKSKKKLHR